MSSPIKTFVIELNAELEKARHAYYVLAAPIMTDAEYDTLEGQLKGAVAANPNLAEFATALNNVGSDIQDTTADLIDSILAGPRPKVVASPAPASTPDKGRIKHVRPMLSIENQYTKDDVVAFFKELQTKGTL